MSLPVIDFRSFTVEDIRQCLENSGYSTTDHEFSVAEDGAFKYIGYSNGNQRYLLGFVDESCSMIEDEEQYLVSQINVHFDTAEGLFCADFSSLSKREGTREEIDEYIEKICN